MELYLMRLGSEEKYFLNSEQNKFVIGRNFACDIIFTSPHVSRRHCEILRVPPRGTLIIKNLKGTNVTYVDDLELQSVNNFAELRIGSKIGLGVPLSFATDDGIKKTNLVFLQLCHSQAEETNKEELQQTAVNSSETHARPSENDPSLFGASRQQPGPQKCNATQSEKIVDGHPAPQRLQSCHPHALPSQQNSTPHSIPSPQPQNTDVKPFSCASQSQLIQQVPSLQQLPQNRLMVHKYATQSQNRIQEPLSELHLQNKHNEDLSIVDHQKVHNVDKISYESVNVYPNQMGSLLTEISGNTSLQSESLRQGKSSNSSHSGNNSQPEPCLSQRNQPEPHEQTPNVEDCCHHNIPGSSQRQGSEYVDITETSIQSNSSQQMNDASNVQNQGGGLNKSSFQGGIIHEPGPSNTLHRSHQVREHEQSQQLNDSQHLGVAIAKPAVELTSRLNDTGIAESHQSCGMKSLGAFDISDHGESNSCVLSSCFKKRIHSPWEKGAHTTKPSARVAPVQAQFANSLLAESVSSKQSSGIVPPLDPVPGHYSNVMHEIQTPELHRIVPLQNNITDLSSVVLPQNQSLEVTHYQQTVQLGNGNAHHENVQECALLEEQNVPQPEVSSSKGLIVSFDNEDSNLEEKQSPSSSRKEQWVHRSTPVDLSSPHIDMNCLSSVRVSSNLSTEKKRIKREEQVGYSVLSSVMTRKGNEHCTTGENNSQNKSLIDDSVRLQQSRNLETTEEKLKFSILDLDDLDAPISIDLAQLDQEPMEETGRKNDGKVRILKHEKDEEILSCEDVEEVCLIDDCKGNLSSAELKDVSGKRKRWINEKPNKEARNNDKNSNQDRKKSLLNELPMLLNDRLVKSVDSNSETELPAQHRKTEKRKRSVIYSDSDSNYKSFEPNKKVDSEISQVRIIKCDEDKEHMSCEDAEVGNSSFAELKDVPGKRKRRIEEKPANEVRYNNKNIKQDGKKARSDELFISLSDESLKDLDSDSENKMPVQHRKAKKRLLIDSDSNSSLKSSSESSREAHSETDPSNSSAVKHGLKSTVNDWSNKQCRIDLKRLPSNIVSDVSKGKTVLTNELLDLTVKSPVPETDCQDSKVGVHTSNEETVIILDYDDDDDDDDELPDLNIPCIKIDAIQPSPMLGSRSKKMKKQRKEKVTDEGIGSKDGVSSRGMKEDKVKDGKVCEDGKHHKHQNSQNESYRDNKQDNNTTERNQEVLQRQSIHSKRALSCSSKNSGESVPTVEKKDTKLGNSSNVSPDVFVGPELLQNVIVKKEKLEETGWKESKIIKEECESIGVIIKKEPSEDSEQASNKAVDDDDDDDDVIFMYSQVDETIWVSSDEEESPSQDISFGPLPSSPDLDIEELFREEEQKLNKDVKNSTSEESKVEDDDLWFPVLSQSLFDDDDIDFKTSKSVSDPTFPHSLPDSSDAKEAHEGDDENISRPAPPEALPGPSGIVASENDEIIPPLNKWWPELSQGFSDDDTEVDDVFKDSHTPGSLKSLDAVIEKLKNKDKRTVQLTDPKMPPPRTKSDNIRKRDKSCKKFYGKHSRQESSRKPTQTRKQKKGQGLRDNLTCKFNLESYKATVEHKPREKHHLLPKVEEKNKKRQTHERKSHLATDKPHVDENISVQRKNASSLQNQEKPRPKVAAKVTHKTRSQRLIDVNLFPSPEITLPKPRKPRYKIPKSSDKSGDKKMESPHDVNAVKTNTVEVLARCDESMPGSTLSSQASHPVAEEQKTNDKGQGTRGIIKMDVKSGSATRKTVHFPSKMEELVQALLISPRKNSERAGKLAARAREVLPREVKLQNYRVPPNYMELFIYHICRWNYDWLEAYRAGLEKQEAGGKSRIVHPPPVVTSTNYPTLILYNSYDDYREIFSNLMYLEIWENIYQDWKRYRQSNMWLPTEIDVVQPTCAATGTGSLKLWIVKMFTLITHDQSVKGLHPRQGSLISLRIQEGAKKMHIFGHVEHFMKNKKRMVTKELEEACPNGEVCLMMGVQIAKEAIQNVKSGKIIFISNVSYIRPSARMWEGLCKLPLSPLCWDILKPSKDVLSCDYGCGEYLVDRMSLNDSQKRAVIEVGNKCIYDQQTPKMSLIHGPPGTGKTRTITALIAQIVKLNRETQSSFCRILLCAPSNAAVDELTLRLVRLREIGTCLRVVRVGVKESISPEVKNCTLDAFVQKQIKMELSTPKNLSIKQEWERRKTMVEHAAEDLQNARKANRSKEVIKQKEVRLTELARSKAEFERSFHAQPTAQEHHHLQQKWQQQVLINAEVITTTLGGCMSGVMTDVFRIPNNFTCCIIDEAGQCKETDTWLPLLLGVRKLVLVGDHRQLPATVLSQLAQGKNLKQSLFERLYHRYVIELQMDNIVHTLNIQYRMHPQIAEWPSQHFYMGKLTTNSHIIQQRSCELKPYIVFDLKTSEEKKDRYNELYNPSEAALVCLIIEILEPKIGQQKVGVITPYQRQKVYLEEKLARYFGRLNIVVNTIDAFQGQERDIIILSFVRGNPAANIGFLSQRQRLNVALTRARKACFIVANLSSLSGNKDWQSLIKNAESRGLLYAITQREESNKHYINSVLLK